jgi:DNA modification methylase
VNKIEFGDCRETMRRWAADGIKVQTCVTSPPYFGLRDYGHEGQIGLEQTPEQYIAAMVEVFRCVRDVLADDGTLWLNIGDSYAAQRGGTHQPAETLAGGKGGKMEDGSIVNRDRHAGYNPTRNAAAIGLKHKDLIGIPWMLAFALRADGWYLRQDIIWHKPNPMPESVRDRCTKAHEYIFLLSKSDRYFFDKDKMQEAAVGGSKGAAASFKRNNSKRGVADVCPASPMPTHRADREDVRYDGPTRNRRSVWSVATRPYKGAHFATFPPALIEPCILAGSRPGDIVLDPFMGSGTTAAVSIQHGRQYLGCELNPDYGPLQHERINQVQESLKDDQLSLVLE